MTRAASRAFFAGLAVLLVSSCAQLGITARTPENPLQAFYYAMDDYSAIQESWVDYARSPAADPEVVVRLAEMDARARVVIRTGVLAATGVGASPNDPQLATLAVALRTIIEQMVLAGGL